MKKILAYILLILILVSSIYAIPFATIATQGLSFANPALGSALNQVVTVAGCVTTVAACLANYATGQVSQEFYGEAIKAIEKVSPEAIKAINTYNQVNGYLKQGASIAQELKVNEQGEVEEGSMKFTKTASIGNIVGKDVKKEDIILSNAQITKKDGITTITLEDNGKLEILDKTTGEKNIYTNIQKGGNIKLDNDGEITSAHFTVGKLEQGKKTAEFKFSYKVSDSNKYNNIIYELPEGTTIDMNEEGTKISNLRKDTYTGISSSQDPENKALSFINEKDGSYIRLDKNGKFYGKGKLGLSNSGSNFDIEEINNNEFSFKIENQKNLGVIIEGGKVTNEADGYSFNVLRERNNVLIAKRDVSIEELDKYKGNWIRDIIINEKVTIEKEEKFIEETLQARSAEDSNLKFEILPKNRIFREKSDSTTTLTFTLEGEAGLDAYKIKDKDVEIGNVLFRIKKGKGQINNANEVAIEIGMDKKVGTKTSFSMLPIGKGNNDVTPMTIVYDSGPKTKTIGSYGIFCDGLYDISGKTLSDYSSNLQCNKKENIRIAILGKLKNPFEE